MTRQFRGILAMFALAIAAPAVAPATVIFTNFASSTPLYDDTNSNPIVNLGTGLDFGQGETFTPGQNATLTQIQLALGCTFQDTCTGTDIYTVSLTSDAGNQPGASIESFTIFGDTLDTFGVNVVPLKLTSVLLPALTAGTQYWVTVTTTSTDQISWNLNNTLPADAQADQALSFDGGESWIVPSGNMNGAFEVDGAIPEPATALLMGGGLVLTGLLGKLLTARRTR
jgi:hypothetical protein